LDPHQHRINGYYGLLFSVLLYLLVRGFVKHKMPPELWLNQPKFPPHEETIFAHRDLLALLQQTMVPLICSGSEFMTDWPEPYTYAPLLVTQLKVQLGCCIFSLILTCCIIWTDYKSGPAFWRRIAPYATLCGIWWVFLLAPTINIIIQIICVSKYSIELHGWSAESWCFSYAVL
jgi:hypothetical protein